MEQTMEQTMSERSKSRSRSRSPVAKKEEEEDDDDCYLYIENIPMYMNVMQIKATLKSIKDHEKFTNDIVFIHRAKGCIDGFKGKCVIEFRTSEACDIAVEILKSVVVEGNTLELIPGAKDRLSGTSKKRIKWCISEEKKQIPDTVYRNSELYGLTIKFLQDLEISPPLSKRIFVGNLHRDVTESKVREVFGMAGHVLIVIIHKLANSARACIMYDHPVEAVQAISMFNKKELFGRPMKVKIDRFKKKRLLPDGLSEVGMGLGPEGNPMTGVRYTVELEPLKNLLMKELKKLQEINKSLKSDDTTLKNNINEEQNKMNTLMQMLQQNFTGPLNAALQQFMANQNAAVGNMLGQSAGAIQNVDHARVYGQTAANQSAFSNQTQPAFDQNAVNQTAFANQTQPAFGQNAVNQTAFANQTQPAFDQNAVNQTAFANQTQLAFGQNAVNQTAFANQTQPVYGQAANQSAFANLSQPPSSRFDVPPPLPQPSVVNQNELVQQWAYQVPWQVPLPTTRFDIPSGGVTQATFPNAGQNWMSGWTQKTQPTGNGSAKPAYENAPKHNDVKKPETKTSDMLLFSNLPASVTSQALVNKMSEVGPLKLAEITGQGRAVVKFQRSEHADKCLKLYDRSKVDGQEITVKYV